jgi:hypothetical protein
MTGPVETASAKAVTALLTRIIELSASESEDESESIKISQEWFDFLALAEKGPKLDELTVRLLCENGVSVPRIFLLYTQQTLENNIVDMDSDTMDFSGVDIVSYQLYLHSHQHATGEDLGSVYEFDKFYDTNSDCATGEDLLFFFDALDDPSIDNCVQFLVDRVEPESIFPPEPVDKPTEEKTQRTPMRSNLRHIWSLLSMEFLKMRQVKFKMFKCVYILILHHVLSGLLPMRGSHTEKGVPNFNSFCTLIGASTEREEPLLDLTNDYNKERMQFSCLGGCICWTILSIWT